LPFFELLDPLIQRRLHTSLTLTTSEHPFFRWLRRAPASDVAAQHFRRHYLQPSPMCICTVFPVYSSKVDLQPPANPSARRFLQSLSHLCLLCIVQVSNFKELADLKRYCSRAMHRESEAYHYIQYDNARAALAKTVTREEQFAQDRDIDQRLVPLMGQHGWQLSEDGRTWSRRPSPEEAG
jgi:hypothetical protein